ncbi:MAG: GntR family transcriptional regulator, partial [Bifidobacteriaceae bacterium]|nr:GntR family transcriptional regulator [Bifidobacteriaceae bacterium]
MPRALSIHLDRSSPVPLYHQITTVIDSAIDSGSLLPGEFLENEVAMAARLGVSRPTARQAMQELVDRGKLVRQRGIGTQVAPTRVRRPVALTSLHSDLLKDGRSPSTEVLSYETVPAASDVAAELEVPEGEAILHLRRLRRADGEPLAIMTNFLPLAVAPTAAELTADGLY